jgi:hypothetical protein
MEQYITFHKLLDLFEEWVDNSPIVKTFGYGNLVDFSSNEEKPVQYPYMFVVPQSIVYNENTTEYSLSILFTDILHADLSNEKDIVSDMSLQARRFISYIKRGMDQTPPLYDYMDIQLSANALPFMERYGDHVAGVALQANIIVFEDINACDYYLDVSPTPTPTPTPTPSPQPFYYLVESCCNGELFVVEDFTSRTVNSGDGYVDVNGNGYQIIGTTVGPATLTWDIAVNDVCNTYPCQQFVIGDGFDASVTATYLDSDDNLYVTGTFYGYKGTYTAAGMVKINNVGDLDTTFSNGVISTIPNIASGYMMAEDVSGNYIYVVGGFTQTTPSVQRIVKLDKTTGQNVWTGITINNPIFGIAVDSNDDVYITGQFTLVNGQTRNRIAKLDSNGNLLPVFTGTGFNNLASNIIINRNGNLVVSGSFITYNGVATNRILEIETTTYTNTGFWGTGSGYANTRIFQRSDNGEYVLIGNDTTINGTPVGKVSKWTELGVNIPFTTALGGIIPTGYFLDETENKIYVSNTQIPAGITRYDYDTGNTDTAFETNIGSLIPATLGANQIVRDLIQVNSNNKIYFGGICVFNNGNPRNRIIRLNQDGTDNTLN